VPYIIRGSITARTCDDCIDDLEGATLRLYRALDDPTLPGRAAADVKHTTSPRSEEELGQLEGRLVGEATLAGGGTFTVELREGYDGGALDVDLYCGTLAGRVPPRPRQLAITTVQPEWRRTEERTLAALNLEIPIRWWCLFRRLLGLWVICGRVTVCGTRTPVPNATVEAFDVDWLQDDALGSGTTDGTGHFRIDYTVLDFERTPLSWLNLELVPGPDLYFRISVLGTVVLNEPRSRGRQPDRENVGPCFCVDLCVDEVPPTPEPYPVFRFIGGYDYVTDIDSGPGGTGLTNGDHRAFFAGLRLNGPIGRTLGGQPLEYRFEVRELPSGSWNPVLPGQIGETLIGFWEALQPTLEVKGVYINATPAPNRIVVTPDAQGWIVMPQDANLSTGLFVPNGNMIVLDSAAMTAWPHSSIAGITAGNSTAPGVPDRFFGIRLRIRQQGNASTEVVSGECRRLAIDNTLYDRVTHGGSWATVQEDNQLAVAMVDVQELAGNGCAGVTNQLHVEVTAAHPNLGSVGLTMAGPGGPYSFTLPAGTATEIAGTATNGFTVASLVKCAYTVTLTVNALLTTGDGAPGPVVDQVSFCKS
jgi:hypothetical protein